MIFLFCEKLNRRIYLKVSKEIKQKQIHNDKRGEDQIHTSHEDKASSQSEDVSNL
jgi:hypothetical protein